MACPEHPCRRHMGWGGEVLKVECDVPRCAACAECVKTQPAVGCGDQGLHACSESDAKRAKLSLRGEGPRPPPPPPPVAPSPPPSASPSCPPSPDVPAPARPPIDPDFEAWARGVLQQKQSIAARAEEDDSQPPPPQLVLPAGGTRGGAWLPSEPRRTLRPPASPDFAAPRGEETFPPPHVAVGASTLALVVLALVIRLRRHAAAEGAQVATTDDRRTLCELVKRLRDEGKLGPTRKRVSGWAAATKEKEEELKKVLQDTYDEESS
ncbi:hypothetical protein AB1Y20_022887 [Prymnesium parvum]|uniref:TNFR-Cys domain-containing protein n=1 Tax=Prymnesium parvum TaxID=97485 RepID=A0AB34JF32_PRYPA